MKHLYKLLFIIAPLVMYSHSLLLNVNDNKDGTITVSGTLDTGQSAEGALLRIKSLSKDETLYLKRLSHNNLIIKIPDEPYKVVLEDIDGDEVEKEGIPPLGGFLKKDTKSNKIEDNKQVKNESCSLAIIVSVIVAFILLLLSILVSINNTRKLMREIQNK